MASTPEPHRVEWYEDPAAEKPRFAPLVLLGVFVDMFLQATG